MQTKRNRCSCGGKLIPEGRTIKCAICNKYVPYKRQRSVLNELCLDRETRNRINYLKRKGQKSGCLKLSEAGEVKGKSLLWIWNRLYLFNTRNKPLRIVYDDLFINYDAGHGSNK